MAAKHYLGGIFDFLQLSRGEFNGPVDAVKDPAKNFLAKGPYSFPFEEFFETDGFIIRIFVRVRSRWEDGVDGME